MDVWKALEFRGRFNHQHSPLFQNSLLILPAVSGELKECGFCPVCSWPGEGTEARTRARARGDGSGRFLESAYAPHLRSFLGSGSGGDVIASDPVISPLPCLSAGPASRKMHYYRYSNAEVSCWYKYLLFSYNIVFWVSH